MTADVRKSIKPEVGARPLAPDPEAVRDRGRHDDDREPRQPERERVEPDVVRDVEVAEPGHLLVEVRRHRGAVEVHPRQRGDPEADLREREQERDGAGDAGDRDEPDDDRPGQRQEDEDRCEPVVHLTHTKTRARTVTPPAIASAYVRTRPVCDVAQITGEAACARRDSGDRAERRSAPRSGRGSERASQHRRPVEDRVVQLVEVELVLEHRAHASGLRDRGASVPSTQPRRPRCRRARARAAARLAKSSCVPARLDERLDGRLQEVGEGVPDARDLDPAADDREQLSTATVHAIQTQGSVRSGRCMCSRAYADGSPPKTMKIIRNV